MNENHGWAWYVIRHRKYHDKYSPICQTCEARGKLGEIVSIDKTGPTKTTGGGNVSTIAFFVLRNNRTRRALTRLAEFHAGAVLRTWAAQRQTVA
jgi:hypothetical protein